MTSSLIYDFDFLELTSLVESWNEPTYRAKQIWQGLYQHFWISPSQFTNLPIPMRTRLSEGLEFRALVPDTILQSSDKQTIKTLFRLHDGMTIETVLMRYHKRYTLCISTQVGCAMGCVFCATGQMGFRRHLSIGEIVAQVIYHAKILHAEGMTVSNVVLMGMGEPFHNYDNSMAAIERLNDPDGYHFGSRRFTISTVGLVPILRRFTAEKRQVNLAISLHASDDNLRTSILPINKKYPLDELFDTCRDYIAATGRRITFEWALIRNINDTPEQAFLLSSRLKGFLCHVNIIPLNPTSGYSEEATTHQRADTFKAILIDSGVPCTIRLRRGIDISAGCGQLASNS